MPEARTYGGRSAGQRRAERRARLLAAGLDLFGRAGYRGTSIESLCTAAGVSTRAFYEEFAGREALLLALHDDVTARALGAALLAAQTAGDVPTAGRVGAVVTAYLDSACADPRSARIAFVEVLGVSTDVEEHRLGWRERMVEFIGSEAATAVARGEAVPRDYTLTAIAFIGAVNELVAEWVVRGRQVPLAVIVAEATRLGVAALTAP